MRNIWTLFNPARFTTMVVYMLQNTEYQTVPYLRWFWRTQRFDRVMYRRTLDRTKAARLLRGGLLVGITIQVLAGLALIGLWRWHDLTGGLLFGLALLVSYPVVWAHLVVVPLIVGREFIAKPRQQRAIVASAKLFAAHPGARIAIAGSYGKTSMKELLVAVLGDAKKVAATPANKNVAVSHAAFARKLTGDEDILIIEYGEGAPGDVARFARITQPTHGVITGLAPAHLDRYKTLQAAGQDIFSLADYLHGEHVYVNTDVTAVKPFMKEPYHRYDRDGALGWSVTDLKLAITGTTFTLVKGKRRIELTSGLLGEHQVGPLSLAAGLALEFGLSEAQIKAGIARTLPFEHRMQPRRQAGAWIIDDTYNGNIEGIRAGTQLLAALPAKRKLYVSPGLVDQGKETQAVHEEMGRLIAAAGPNMVVLMRNSAAGHIQTGLKVGGYEGEVQLEADPLGFYTNLDQFVAAGDLVLLQNDWTDNYA